MGFEATLGLLIGNLGVTLPQLVLIVTTIGCLIFMALEVRLGLMILFFLYGVELLIFWAGGSSAETLILFGSALLASFVLMTLSLLMTKSKQGYSQGGIL